MQTSDLSNIVNAGNTVLEVLERFFPFWGIEGKALEVYINEIEKSDKPKEWKVIEIYDAKRRMKKLKNLSKVLEFASDDLTENEIKRASYTDHEDWFDKFIDHAGSVSDSEIQIIWGKILAEEIRHKGSAPSGIFRILSEINSNTAKVFRTLCEQQLQFVVLNDQDRIECPMRQLVVFDESLSFYRDQGITLYFVNELEALGLISRNPGLYNTFPTANRVLVSDGVSTECIMLKEDKRLDLGMMMFTISGNYLSRLCKPSFAKGQMEVMKKYYLGRKYKFMEDNICKVSVNGSVINVSNVKGTIY